jgi:hypothetical protein
MPTHAIGVTGPPAVASVTGPALELGALLAGDGTFQGARGVEGTVDTGSWTLTSDLRVGERPRFRPSPVHDNATRAGSGTWSALGSMS